MRWTAFTMPLAMALVGFISVAPTYAREPIKIDAADARQFIGKWVEVTFTVAAVSGNSAGYRELYSKKEWSDPDNLFIRLPDNLVDAVRQWGGASDLRTPFEKQKISVTGHLALLTFPDVPNGDWPVIYVDDIHSLKRVGRTSQALPTAEYQKQMLGGFSVYFASDAALTAKAKQHAVEILRTELERIALITPAQALVCLREIKLFIVPQGFGRGGAYYEPLSASKDYLQGGENPDLAGSVILEIGKAFDLLQTIQPGLLLHELAHGYFDRMDGWKSHGLNKAYKNAMENKLYDEVVHITRGPVEAYAKTNPDEYFAELSESLLLRNDHFPFSANELASHDPVGFSAVKEFWSCRAIDLNCN